MVYLKEISRSIATGLQFGSETNSKVAIDKDLSCAELNYRKSSNEVLVRVEVSFNTLLLILFLKPELFTV